MRPNRTPPTSSSVEGSPSSVDGSRREPRRHATAARSSRAMNIAIDRSVTPALGTNISITYHGRQPEMTRRDAESVAGRPVKPGGFRSCKTGAR